SENGIFYANHHGVVQHAVSDVKGRNGIGGPYTDRGILMCYDGCNPDTWEGLQGTDSFFPYKVGKKWYAIYGSATTQYKNGDERRKWQVGLAQADKIEGPWTRMSELNPLNFVDFAENPIVMELQKGIYIAIVDGGPWINKPGFSLSTDGLKWTPLKHFELEPKVKKWWRTMRTPLSLIKEDDGTYTMFFTAFKDYPGQPTFGTLSKLTLKVKYAPTAK
ncbi:MAG: glycoside hydrolase, partial [Tannerella sp.]|nr:glycoside hydrolase [Tannerella sp.]